MNQSHGVPCRRLVDVSRGVPASKLNLDTGVYGRG